MTERLTKREARLQVFVDEYIIDFNGLRSAKEAGFSAHTAGQAASRLLKNVKVQKAVQDALQKRSERTQITQDRVVTELARCAFVDPRNFFDDDGKLIDINDLDEDTARALAGLEYHSLWENSSDTKEKQTEAIGQTTKIKMVDKVRCLQILLEHVKGTKGDGSGKIPTSINIQVNGVQPDQSVQTAPKPGIVINGVEILED